MKKSILVNNIIFILFSMVCILVMYICCKLILFNKTPHVYIPPYTKKILNKSKKEQNPSNALQVIYKLDSLNEPVNGISKADIILEYVNSQNKLIYKALYFNQKPTKILTSADSQEINNLQIPKFNFNNDENIDLKGETANFIFINLNDYFSSNFIFKNNQYYHYKPTTQHIDKWNKEPVKVSNIVVQVVNCKNDKENINGTGTGLLFSAGKAMDIKWNKDINSPIKITDKNGHDISMSKGNTWWIILDNHSLISYN